MDTLKQSIKNNIVQIFNIIPPVLRLLISLKVSEVLLNESMDLLTVSLHLAISCLY